MPNAATAILNVATRSCLPLAVRVYPPSQPNPPERKRRRLEDGVFVFDCETRTDPTQRLLFVSYRFYKGGECLEEGLVYAPDLSASELDILRRYVRKFRADTGKNGTPQLQLLSLREFIKRLYLAAYKGRALLVGYNLPFDVSRVAYSVGAGRRRLAGGFSFALSTYTDKNGLEHPNNFYPRFGIKQIDSKRALKRFLSPNDPDASDLEETTPEDEVNKKRRPFAGHIVDVRTLVFALTDKSYSLDAACRAFGVENGKLTISQHGVLTEDYITYNRA